MWKQPLEFIEPQRPIVERGRQTESVVDEIFLARTIAAIHAANLRHGHMALIDEHQRIARQVVDQRRRRLARLAPGQVPRVVFDAFAEPDLAHHFEIEAGALLDSLRLDELHLRYEEFPLLCELELDGFDRVQHFFSSGNVVR